MTPEQRALMERMEERFVYAPEAHAIRAALEEIDRLKAELERTQEERSEWKYKEYDRSETCLRLLDRAEAAEAERDALRKENERLAKVEAAASSDDGCMGDGYRLFQERNRLQIDLATAEAERDALKAKLEHVTRERDSLEDAAVAHRAHCSRELSASDQIAKHLHEAKVGAEAERDALQERVREYQREVERRDELLSGADADLASARAWARAWKRSASMRRVDAYAERADLAASEARVRQLEDVGRTLATRLEEAIHELEDLGAGSAPSRYGMVNGSVVNADSALSPKPTDAPFPELKNYDALTSGRISRHEFARREVERGASEPTPPESPLRAENEPEECGSCRGCGHFSKYGKPSVDRRDRNCMDCSGTGRALKGAP